MRVIKIHETLYDVTLKRGHYASIELNGFNGYWEIFCNQHKTINVRGTIEDAIEVYKNHK